MTYKLSSLFDGSGGFPLAGALCGIEPCWASEVEPYPIAVTRSRFPRVKHLGDISKINGAEVEPVDIITFGSPCQDLSVAGKRAGIKHEVNGDEETTRSGLFMEAVRIIKEMKEATDGKYPTFALWENVPGAFSSNKGEDFRVVLEELIKIVEPHAIMPAVPKKGWAYADSYVGDGWSLAYRTFDAQYWGVPQRRRRIHLILDLRGERAREVLFEREGVRGYSAQGGTPWQEAACRAERCFGAEDHARGFDGYNADLNGGLDAVGFDSYNLCLTGGVGRTLSTPSGGLNEHIPVVLDPKTYAIDQGGGKSACNIQAEKSPTLVQVNKSATLATSNDQYLFVPQQEPTPIHDKATRYKGGGSTRAGDGAGNGLGVGKPGDPMYTPTTGDKHAVAFLASGKSTVGTLIANAGTNLWLGNQEAFSGDYHIIEDHPPQYLVRRLTPVECARLQGFADCWGDIDEKTQLTPEEYEFWLEVRNTHAAINGKTVKDYNEKQMLTWYNKLHTDSAEYKMWGNGIALPPALYCMQGMVDALEKEEGLWVL